MYKTNLPLGTYASVTYTWYYLDAAGGMLWLSAKYNAAPGDQAYFSAIRVGFKIMYVTDNYTLLAYASTMYGSSPVDGQSPQYIFGLLKYLSPENLAGLTFHVEVDLTQNGQNTTINYNSLPVQAYITCIAPDSPAVPHALDISPWNIDLPVVFKADLELNGSHSWYEAEFKNPSGSPSSFSYNDCGDNLSQFTRNDMLSYVNVNGEVQWRVRACNYQGASAWSDWVTVNFWEPIAGTLSVSTQASIKPNQHNVVCTFNLTSGHTNPTYTWVLEKWYNNDWAHVASGGSTSSQSWLGLADVAGGVQYRVRLNVTGYKYGVYTAEEFTAYTQYPSNI